MVAHPANITLVPEFCLFIPSTVCDGYWIVTSAEPAQGSWIRFDKTNTRGDFASEFELEGIASRHQ